MDMAEILRNVKGHAPKFDRIKQYWQSCEITSDEIAKYSELYELSQIRERKVLSVPAT